MSTELTLGIYAGSIPRGLDSSGSEYRRLYEAIDAAALNGEPFAIIRYGRRLTVTLEDAAGCRPCREGRHEDCQLVWSSDSDETCGCDQRTLHAQLRGERGRELAARVALYRESRR